jgi:hypothetical protein
MIRLESTTNEKFKYMEGKRLGESHFKIGTIICVNWKCVKRKGLGCLQFLKMN